MKFKVGEIIKCNCRHCKGKGLAKITKISNGCIRATWIFGSFTGDIGYFYSERSLKKAGCPNSGIIIKED